MGESRVIQQRPFSPETRSSGVLLHVTSLPSPHGIGDLGAPARRWIDQLAQAGQRWWQVLPLSPTGRGNSPYHSLSTYALSELLVCPEDLAADGLLEPSTLTPPAFPEDHVDFDAVTDWKRELLGQAWEAFRDGRGGSELEDDFAQFRRDHADWLDDYALFVALWQKFDVEHYLEWRPELAMREPAALAEARRHVEAAIDQCSFNQFLLFRQAEAIRQYAAEHNVGIIGDLPFFISPISAEVWANPQLFLLDEHSRPTFVGGVPPDYFSADGQLWGNPVYNWPAHQASGYQWWIARVSSLLDQVDVIRIDHFRGLAAAWHVPADAETAKVGEWVPGPGADLLQAVQEALGGLPLIAEDLGSITDDVVELREQFEMPGMRVLQFAFDGEPQNPFLPENYVENTIVYTGTHDNDTSRGWYASLDSKTREYIHEALGWTDVAEDEAAWGLIRVAWESLAAVAIAPLQDILNLGTQARMNVPGSAQGNWKWRCTEEQLATANFAQLRKLTEQTGRMA